MLQLEQKCREYNKHGQLLQLIPATAENAFGIDYELTPNPANQHRFISTVRVSVSSFTLSVL